MIPSNRLNLSLFAIFVTPEFFLYSKIIHKLKIHVRAHFGVVTIGPDRSCARTANYYHN